MRKSIGPIAAVVGALIAVVGGILVFGMEVDSAAPLLMGGIFLTAFSGLIAAATRRAPRSVVFGTPAHGIVTSIQEAGGG